MKGKTMIAVDSVGPGHPDEEPKGRMRKPRAPGGQASRNPGGREAAKSDRATPKSADAGLGKLSTYVPHSLLKKLTVATAAWDLDKSDIVTQSLERTLASIVFYDKSASKPSGDNGEDRQTGTAA